MIEKERVKEIAERVFSDHKLFFTFSMFGSSGTYFFYSLFDNHPRLYNIPGEFHKWPILPVDFDSEPPEIHISRILNGNERFFDFSKDLDPNNSLNKLGDSRDQTIKINKNEFETYLHQILETADFNLENYYLAVSMAYNFSRNRILDSGYFIAHAHDFPRAMEIKRKIPNCQLIGVVRQPVNVYKSFCKRKFNESKDFSRPKRRNDFLAYYQPSNIGTIKKFHDLLDEINDEIKVVSIEELHVNPESSMRKVALELGLKYDESLLESTMAGLKWWGSHYTRLHGFSDKLHKQVDAKNVGLGDAYALLKFTLNYQKHIGYTNRREITSYMDLRSRFSGLAYFKNRTRLLAATIKHGKGLKCFYYSSFCWVRDLYNFTKLRLLFENRLINELARRDREADYSKLKLMNPIGKDSINNPKYL